MPPNLSLKRSGASPKNRRNDPKGGTPIYGKWVLHRERRLWFLYPEPICGYLRVSKARFKKCLLISR